MLPQPKAMPDPNPNPHPLLKKHSNVLRIFAQGLVYSVAVGFLTHVFDTTVPFVIMMLSSICIGFNEIVPVHLYALKTHNIWKRISMILLGTLTGTGMVFVMNEGLFGRDFKLRDLALCLAGGVFFGSVYLGLASYQYKQMRLHRLLQSVAARKKLAEEALELNRYRLLAAQIKPHFFFNTLGNVLALMRTDTARAESLLSALAEYLDSVLTLSSKATVELSHELEAARNYLEIQGTRFPKLGFEIDVPAQMTRLRIPPLVLLTLVENAVHHGIGARAGAGRIEIRGEIDDAQCRLLVIDDGPGLRPPPAQRPAIPPRIPAKWLPGGATRNHGMGIQNVRKRLESTFGASSTEVLLMPRPDAEHGCIARITMPFAPKTFAIPA